MNNQEFKTVLPTCKTFPPKDSRISAQHSRHFHLWDSGISPQTFKTFTWDSRISLNIPELHPLSKHFKTAFFSFPNQPPVISVFTHRAGFGESNHLQVGSSLEVNT